MPTPSGPQGEQRGRVRSVVVGHRRMGIEVPGPASTDGGTIEKGGETCKTGADLRGGTEKKAPPPP